MNQAIGPGDAYMRQWTSPSLVQVMIWDLFISIPLS